jgi:phosphatidylglycerophosphate synthase
MPSPVSPPSTTAVVLVAASTDEGGAAALLAWEQTTILRRLLDQLATLDVARVHVLARPAFADAIDAELASFTALDAELHPTATIADDLREIAAIAGQGRGTLIVVNGDVVTHREALAGLLADPRVSTGVLSTGGRTGRPFTFRIRSRRGRIVGANSAFHYCHHSTGSFLGVLKVSAEDRAVVVAQCARLAQLADAPPPSWVEEYDFKAIRWRQALARTHVRQALRLAQEEGTLPPPGLPAPGPTGEYGPADLAAVALPPEREQELRRRLAAGREDAGALVLVGLVRNGTPVGNSYLRELFWARPLSPEDVAAATERIAEFDEDKVLLETAVKATDGFFTTFLVSPYSRYIARWAAHRGLTPNQVTSFSLLLGFLTAAAFATGERWGLIAGAVLLQLAFTFDCVDGQLARYTRQFSKLGAWLDSVFDRTKEYVVFAGLGIGASRTGDSVWLLAGAALTLQIVRHTFDFSYAAAAHQVIAAEQPVPLEQAWDSATKPPPPGETREPAAAETHVDADHDHDIETSPAPAPATAPGGAPVPALPLPKRLAAGALRSWRRLDRQPAIPWIKRIVAFPIGERFAAISITAALWSAHTTFAVLLVWGGAAALYGLAGRLLRSVAR